MRWSPTEGMSGRLTVNGWTASPIAMSHHRIMILPPSGGSVRTTERWDSYGAGTLPDDWKISHTRQSACFPGVSGTNTERYRTINHSFNAVWDSRAGCASSPLLHTQALLKGSEVFGKLCLFKIVNFLLTFEKMVVKDAFNWVRIWRLLF